MKILSVDPNGKSVLLRFSADESAIVFAEYYHFKKDEYILFEECTHKSSLLMLLAGFKNFNGYDFVIELIRQNGKRAAQTHMNHAFRSWCAGKERFPPLRERMQKRTDDTWFYLQDPYANES